MGVPPPRPFVIGNIVELFSDSMHLYLSVISIISQLSNSFLETLKIRSKKKMICFYLRLNLLICIKLNRNVVANQHKWSPVLWGRKVFRVPETFHGLLKSMTSTFAGSRVLVETFQKLHGGFVIDCPE